MGVVPSPLRIVPSPYPCPSVANHRLAPLMEAGDTSGVSYGALTLSLSHGARELLPYLSYIKFSWRMEVARVPSPRGRGIG